MWDLFTKKSLSSSDLVPSEGSAGASFSSGAPAATPAPLAGAAGAGAGAAPPRPSQPVPVPMPPMGTSPTPSGGRSFKALLKQAISFKDMRIVYASGTPSQLMLDGAAPGAGGPGAGGGSTATGAVAASAGADGGGGGGGGGGAGSGGMRHVPSTFSLGGPAVLQRSSGSTRVAVEKSKLVIIMVGLPGRGKTFLCNKLKCYLNWLGHPTEHFNVGQYRRKHKGSELQDASFFDPHNLEGLAAREHAFHLALADTLDYLDTDEGQVAIFDATNSTSERRKKLATALQRAAHRYVFIETICTDASILETNYLNKLRYSPDYRGCDTAQALHDFRDRIFKYEQVYEPIVERDIHYIKLTDMVTGHGHIDINRISGYLPGKIVFFLMQVCKSGMTNARRIWLTRHGESEYNRQALIGGDSGLSAVGEQYAHTLPEVLLSRMPRDDEGVPVPVSVWTSTLRRTIQTAVYLPFPKLRWKALDEIDAGVCDGMTYAEIAQRHPDEFAARKRDKLRYRYPRGESYLDLVARLEPVIMEMEREGESIAIVAHQAVLRVIFGYLTAKPQEEIPAIAIPLHTLIELTPMPDGTMGVAYIPVPVGDTSSHGGSLHGEPLAQRRDTPAAPLDSVGASGTGEEVHIGPALPQSRPHALETTASCSSRASKELAAAAAAVTAAAASGSRMGEV